MKDCLGPLQFNKTISDLSKVGTGLEEHTSKIIDANKLTLDASNQCIGLIPEEFDTRDRLRARKLPQGFRESFAPNRGAESLIDVPDVQAKVVPHAIQTRRHKTMCAECNGIAISLISNWKGKRLLYTGV
jgi:hypothetical protein